jgi:hypothetical protein
MAPDFPPKLVVFDLRFESDILQGTSDILQGTLEYVEVSQRGERLRVCWEGIPEIPGFLPVGGGVAHVYRTDNMLVLPRRENVRPKSLGDSRYSWQEGLQPNDPWLMFILILPQRYTLANPRPVPVSAAEFEGRLALYWILEGGEFNRTYVEWGVKEFEGSLSLEIEKINRSYSTLKVPQESGIDVLSVETSDLSPAENPFDVFICHNSGDKPEIRKINTALQAAGITTWLDEEQLTPGLPWQPELERQIGNIKSACVFVGRNSTGPWQDFEIRAFLNEFANRGCPVIPVILPDATEVPDLPLFLKQMTWIDLREDYRKNFSRLLAALKQR